MSTPALQALRDAAGGAAAGGGAGGGGGAGAGADAAAAAAAAAAAKAAGGAGDAGGGGTGGQWWAPLAANDADATSWFQNKNYADPKAGLTAWRGLERENATLRGARPGYPVDTMGPDGKTPVKPTDDQVRAWRTVTGVPESADKYDLGQVPPGAPPEFSQFMKEGLLAAHVPAAMAPALAKAYESAVTRLETALRAQEDQASKQALLQLEKDWGSGWAEGKATAARAEAWFTQRTGITDMQMRTMEATLGTAKFLTFMREMGTLGAESRFAGSGGSKGGEFGQGAAEAQRELDDIQAKRAAGQISNGDYNELMKKGGRIEQLGARIAAGMAPQQ